MNIIKQLVDADGNNIYPIGYVQGGVRLDLKFDNSDHGTTYTPTTVDVDLSDYEYVLIEYTFYQTNVNKGCIVAKVGTVARMFYVTDSSTNNNNAAYRNVTVGTTSITFDVGRRGTTTRDDGTCIPDKIYGIRMSYIVPTTVQGLQYIEV